MNTSHPLRIVRLSLLATAMALLLLGAGSYWVWNARNRPASISGDWFLDDLRTEGDDAALVHFSQGGVYDEGEGEFAGRWRYRNGRLFLRAWKIDKHSDLVRTIQDTAIYSWFVESHEFSLRVEFSEDGKEMTLTADGEEPRCRLRRDRR